MNNKIFYTKNGWVCERYPLFYSANGCDFIEVEENEIHNTYCTIPHHAWKVENGRLILARYEPDTNIEACKKELEQLEEWFEIYDNQVKQYNRCLRLGIAYDCKHGSIEELDAEAIKNAKRLKELRVLLDE